MFYGSDAPLLSALSSFVAQHCRGEGTHNSSELSPTSLHTLSGCFFVLIVDVMSKEFTSDRHFSTTLDNRKTKIERVERDAGYDRYVESSRCHDASLCKRQIKSESCIRLCPENGLCLCVQASWLAFHTYKCWHVHQLWHSQTSSDNKMLVQKPFALASCSRVLACHIAHLNESRH